MSESFVNLLSGYGQRVDDALEQWLPSDSANVCESGSLQQAMKYSALAGGKRIRPALCLMVAEELGHTSQAAILAGCAFELIHTYSLIHDDLPAMDNDDLRRGKPTSHKVFGEALAILAGDSLLTLAFSWLASLEDYGVDASDVTKIIRLVSEASGHEGMAGGQALDIVSENRSIDLEELEKIHSMKTGALITAPIKTGAILAGAPEEELLMLESFGKKAGLLFQVVDDILDVVGETSMMGKNSGRDIQLGKSTYPSLMGLEGAREYAREIHCGAINDLKFFSGRLSILQDFADYLLTRQK